MARQRKSKFKTVITWLLLLLLLAGGIGLILHFAGIEKDDITDIVKPVFRIEYGENVYKTDNENNVIALPASGQARFEVKGANSFTAVIVPNVTADADFNYTVDGKTYSFSCENDLSVGFDLKCYDKAFTVNADNYSPESVLSKIWSMPEINIDFYEITNPYKIIVTSSSGEIIEIVFGGNLSNAIVKLDKTEIVF